MTTYAQDQLADTGPLATLEELAADLVEEAGDDIWQYERYNENLVVLSYTGQWTIYTLNARVAEDNELVLVCTFPATCAANRLLQFHRLTNLISSTVRRAHLIVAEDEGRVIFRTWADIDQFGSVDPDRIADMIDLAVETCEEFYPAFLAIGWDDDCQTAEEAFLLPIKQPFGTA